MLRNISRALMSSKQTLMADHSSQSSYSQNYKRPVPSFFGSPRFGIFTVKNLAETEVVESPTSILDTKFSPFANLFSDDTNPPITSPKILPEKKHSWEKLEHSKGIGLALIDVLTNKTVEENPSSKPNDKKVFFASKLRVQVPQLPASNLSPTQSPKSPADFGTKTRKQTQLFLSGSANSPIQTIDSPRVVTGCLPVTEEMELSEDYTCVISHGPNPKTTHIFDNCVIESYCSLSDHNKFSSPSENFLSFCYTCKKNLEQKNDIYIYRGEKAFCSQECRYQEMLLDEVEN